MGGCATKPKVLKGEEAEAPAPEQPGKQEVADINTAVSSAEAKDVAIVDEDAEKNNNKKVEGENNNNNNNNNGDGGDDEEGVNNKVKEIAEDERADGLESKPRSLSNLFKNEEGKDSTVVENATSEEVKEESKEAEKPKDESEAKQPEVAESEVTVEQSPEFVDAPEKADAEKAAFETPRDILSETKEFPETQKEATGSSEEKKTEAAGSAPAAADEKKTEEA